MGAGAYLASEGCGLPDDVGLGCGCIVSLAIFLGLCIGTSVLIDHISDKNNNETTPPVQKTEQRVVTNNKAQTNQIQHVLNTGKTR